MPNHTIYAELAERTDGAFLLGVVGPVRTGKSTFIKRFMETLVIPRIESEFVRERAIDELPQSGSGKTIMTSEPKFVPEEAVRIDLEDETPISVRLIDCVGYMVDGAGGQFENGEERLVTTPWFDREVTMSEAAELGTGKVISEHSTVGIVVTTDGSFGELNRDAFLNAEKRVIEELKALGKPFVVLLNSNAPESENARRIANEIEASYQVNCLCVDCQRMTEDTIQKIMQTVLEEFPLYSVSFFLPDWLEALPAGNSLRQGLYEDILSCFSSCEKIRDIPCAMTEFASGKSIKSVELNRTRLGTGEAAVSVQLPRELYYESLSEETGMTIANDGELFTVLSEMSVIKADYEHLQSALADVREKGYGVVLPDAGQMKLEEPRIVRQGGKYSVRLKASAPAIHMMMTNIETEVTPALGGETASEDIINFLLQGFEGDVNRIWQSNIFGKSLYDIAGESLTGKISTMPDNVRKRLQVTVERIVNEGSSGLICILL